MAAARTLALAQLLGQAVGAAPRPAEDDGRAGVLDDVDGMVLAVHVGDLPEQVPGGGDVGLDVTHLVAGRAVLVTVGDDLDVTVQRGREQHGLAVVGGGVEQALDGGQEAHVGHAVGLVDDDDLDVLEVDVAALDQVLEAAGAGHQDVDALAQRAALAAVADAAVDRHGPALADGEQGRELLVDLLGQLTGGGQDQRPGAAGRALADAGGQGDAEGQGLARAGRGPAADVAAGEEVRDGRRLDREGLGDARLGEDPDDVVGHAEIGEGGGHEGVLLLTARFERTGARRAADRNGGEAIQPERGLMGDAVPGSFE